MFLPSLARETEALPVVPPVAQADDDLCGEIIKDEPPKLWVRYVIYKILTVHYSVFLL